MQGETEMECSEGEEHEAENVGLEAPDDDLIPSQTETETNEQEENLVSERRYPLRIRKAKCYDDYVYRLGEHSEAVGSDRIHLRGE